jgi:hypothetical protein
MPQIYVLKISHTPLVLSIFSQLRVSALWAIIRPFINLDTGNHIQLKKEISSFTLKILWELPTVARNGPLMCPDTGAQLTPALWSRLALQIRNSPFSWLSFEPTDSTQVVIHPTALTWFAHPPATEWPVWWSCCKKGKTFWAHKHCP